MTEPIGMGVIGIDHRHIYTMVGHLRDAGARLRGWWTEGSPTTLAGFETRFPDAPRVESAQMLLDDPSVQVILTAAVPDERAGIALTAMRAGKDVITDKPGCLTGSDLDRIRRTVAETGRIWSVDFSERFEVPAVTRAARLIGEGAIGEVIQTLGIGPHRMNAATRPDWFFERQRSGGILTDIGSHQIDQFLALTGSQDAEITLAAADCRKRPGFQDFGEVALRSDRARGYFRVDWFTPDALPVWGDGRLFVLGTEGSIELRKYVDVGGADGSDHLLLVNGRRCERIDASCDALPYFPAILSDIRDRGETAVSQAHTFRVMELAIRAQDIAERGSC